MSSGGQVDGQLPVQPPRGYVWLAASLGIAYLAKVVERDSGPGKYLSTALIYLAGYGSLLCAITLAAYVKEFRRADVTWDKTVKTGKVDIPG